MTRISCFVCFVCSCLLLTACTGRRRADTDAGPGLDASTDASSDGQMGLMDAGPPDSGPGLQCDGGEVACSGACTSVDRDHDNCGRCGDVCPSGLGCVGGTCSCMTPMIACGGACLDPSSDRNNCGACDHICPSDQTCTGGSCVAICGDAERRAR